MMVQFLRAPISVPPQSPDDIRVGHRIRSRGDTSSPRIVLLGVPIDKGVALNGGRVGAAEAPDAIRLGLYRLTAPADNPTPFLSLIDATEDWGNIVCAGSVEETHALIGEVVHECIGRGIIPILLGGGHEISYGHVCGYARAKKQVSILNVDAHLDVRPLINGKAHSGSPFRQALEDPSRVVQSYTVVGALRHAVSSDHLSYLQKNRGELVWEKDGSLERPVPWPKGSSTMVTMDIDAIDSVYAPGRSALAPGGISSQLFLSIAEEAGRRHEVSSFDLVEVNPKFDHDNRTSRLAALAVWRFLKGVGER